MLRKFVHIVASLMLLIQLGMVPVVYAVEDAASSTESTPCAEMPGATDSVDESCCEAECLISACNMPCAQATVALPNDGLSIASDENGSNAKSSLASRAIPPYDDPLIRPPATS